jgi:hypothetical protein
MAATTSSGVELDLADRALQPDPDRFPRDLHPTIAG